jgi:hypothetical protein
MAPPHKRKNRRFTLRYRIRVKFQSAGKHSQLDGVTKNVSVGGLLLESSSPIPEDCPVTFAIMAQGQNAIRPIKFAGKGKVVRVKPEPAREGYAIALKCVRPIEFHPVM